LLESKGPPIRLLSSVGDVESPIHFLQYFFALIVIIIILLARSSLSGRRISAVITFYGPAT